MVDQVQEITIQNIEESQIVERITETIQKIKAKKDERKTAKEMLEDHLEADNEYSTTLTEKEDAAEKLKHIRAKIVNQDRTGIDLTETVKEKNEEVKDLQDSLSAQLQIYYEKTKKTEIVTKDGVKRRIKTKWAVSAGQQSLF